MKERVFSSVPTVKGERKIIIVEKVSAKDKLINLLKEFSQNGIIDISSFRVANPKEYNKLNYHFGDTDKAIKEAGLVKTSYNNHMSVREALAYDFLRRCIARKTNPLTLCKRFCCTNVTLYDLFFQLYTISEEKKESDLKYFEYDKPNHDFGNRSVRVIKDMLVFEYLNKLRFKENLTLEEIGKKYNCTRSAIEQLHSSLKKYERKKENGKKNQPKSPEHE